MYAASIRFYDVRVRRAIELVREQLRRRSELIPAGFSWSFVVLFDTGMVLVLIVSIVQRPRADLLAAMVAAVVAKLPFLLFYLAGFERSPALIWATYWPATAILLFATSTPIRTDFAPLLLALMLGCLGSLVRRLYGALAFGSAVLLLAAASAAHRLDEVALYLSCVALSWLVGYLMRTQTQLLIKQQKLQAHLTEHAADDERRRIAREVHDVIVRSLSVTLLHLTGARRGLQQDHDIDDAVDALTGAERLGRQAMADIRRTVGLLENGPIATAPEPSVADIPDLIDDFVQAGLPVTLGTEGQHDQVSAAVGLALYRITQESLANVAKHAPTSKATVSLVISPSAATLSIVNKLPVSVRATPTSQHGHGVSGMRQRVELLDGTINAGPSPEGWSVRAEIPLTDPNSS